MPLNPFAPRSHSWSGALCSLALAAASSGESPQDDQRELFAVRLEGRWSVHRGDVPGGPAAGADPRLDVAAWERASLPEKSAEAGQSRVTWYRTEFTWGSRHVPPAFLVIGQIEGEDAVYLNGLPVGGTAGEEARGAHGRRARIYRFEAPWIVAGRNVLAVRVDGIEAHAGRIIGGPLRLASGAEALRTLGPSRMAPGLAAAANFGIAALADERGRLLGRVVAESSVEGGIELGWGNLSIADRDTRVEVALEECEKNEIDLRWPMASFRAVDRRLGDLRIEGEMFAPLAWREEWMCAMPIVMIDLRLENRGVFPREIDIVLRFQERQPRAAATGLAGFDEIGSRIGYTGVQIGALALALDGAVEAKMPLPGFLKLTSSVQVASGGMQRVRAVLAYREDSLRWNEGDPGVTRVIDIAWSQWQQIRDQTVGFDRGMPSTGDPELDAAIRAYGSFAARRTHYERSGLAYIRTDARDAGGGAEEAFFTSSAHLVLWPTLEELMIVSWAGKILAELPTTDPPAFVLPHLWYAARAIRLARWKGQATRVTPDISRAFKRSVAAVLRADRDGDGLPEPSAGEDRDLVAFLALHVLEATTIASSSLRLDERENAVVAQRLEKARVTVLALPMPEDAHARRARAWSWIFPSSATLELASASLAAVDALATPCGIAQSLATVEQPARTEPALDFLDALGRARLGFAPQGLELARRALRADLGASHTRPPSRLLAGCEPASRGRDGARNAAFLMFATQGWLGWTRREGELEIAPWIDSEQPDIQSNVVVPEGLIGWRRRAREGGWTFGCEATLAYPLDCAFLLRIAAGEAPPTLRVVEAEAPKTEGEPGPTEIQSDVPPTRLEVVERYGARFARVPVRLETRHPVRFEIDRAK